MFSIEEAKYAQPRAFDNIPVGVRHEWGSETIVRELEAEATAVHHARMGKLRNAAMKLFQRITDSVLKSGSKPKMGSVLALRIGD
ncbi:MAG: hypothetical protein ABL907_14110 [Hyphomicrobium sp.]